MEDFLKSKYKKREKWTKSLVCHAMLHTTMTDLSHIVYSNDLIINCGLFQV